MSKSETSRDGDAFAINALEELANRGRATHIDDYAAEVRLTEEGKNALRGDFRAAEQALVDGTTRPISQFVTQLGRVDTTARKAAESPSPKRRFRGLRRTL